MIFIHSCKQWTITNICIVLTNLCIVLRGPSHGRRFTLSRFSINTVYLAIRFCSAGFARFHFRTMHYYERKPRSCNGNLIVLTINPIQNLLLTGSAGHYSPHRLHFESYCGHCLLFPKSGDSRPIGCLMPVRHCLVYESWPIWILVASTVCRIMAYVCFVALSP